MPFGKEAILFYQARISYRCICRGDHWSSALLGVCRLNWASKTSQYGASRTSQYGASRTSPPTAKSTRSVVFHQCVALHIITRMCAYHHAFACISSTRGCITRSHPPLRGAPCDSLFKTLTFLSLALACTLSTNENKFSSVNVSQREPYEKTTPEGVVFDCAI